jgi:hypothetical protein
MLAAHVEKFKKTLSDNSSTKMKRQGKGVPEFHWEAIEKAMRTSCPETTYSRTQMKNKKNSLSRGSGKQKPWDPWTTEATPEEIEAAHQSHLANRRRRVCQQYVTRVVHMSQYALL